MSSTSYQNHSDAIEIIRKNLLRYLNELSKDSNYFSVISGFVWGATSQQMIFDIAVTYKSNMIAVIEYVDGDQKDLRETTQFMAPYVFLYTKSFLFACYSRKTDTFMICTKDTFKSLEDVRLQDVRSLRSIARMVFEFVKSNNESENKTNNKISRNHLVFYDEDSQKELDPEWCRTQLDSVPCNKICRYSSLDSLFSSLKYQTFRMNGLPGMNDKDEGQIIWKIIDNRLPNETIKQRKGLINSAFIISYSSDDKIDDLTQWRLYGDDAKGVCCVFSVQLDKVKDRFFLHPITYYDYDMIKMDGITDNKVINKLINHMENLSDLDYFDPTPLINFFKRKIFSIEEEVRLLVDNKESKAYTTPPFQREWLLTNSNNILNPYIDIPFKDFPLKLERIILGPNMNEIDTIQIQLEAMLNQLGLGVEVGVSEITSYRNKTN